MKSYDLVIDSSDWFCPVRRTDRWVIAPRLIMPKLSLHRNLVSGISIKLTVSSCHSEHHCAVNYPFKKSPWREPASPSGQEIRVARCCWCVGGWWRRRRRRRPRPSLPSQSVFSSVLCLQPASIFVIQPPVPSQVGAHPATPVLFIV